MSDGKIIKVIFFGDIVGKPGRVAVRDFLQNNDTFKNYDFIIANIENTFPKINFNDRCDKNAK